MRRNMLALVAIIAVVLFAVTGLEAADYVPGQLIVKLEHGVLEMTGVDEVSISQVTIHHQGLAQVLQSYGTQSVEKVFKTLSAQAGETFNDVSQVYLFRMDPSLDMELVADQLEQLPYVKYAEVNGRIVYCSEPRDPPNDPSFGYIPYEDPYQCPYQWGLHNDYPEYDEPDWDINALEAWGIQVGNPNILLCIIDSGLEDEHCNDDFPEEPERVDEFYGRVAPDGKYPTSNTDDTIGHGTFCAGLAAATTNSGQGDVGPEKEGWVVGIAGVAGGWYDSDPNLNEEGVKLLIAKDQGNIAFINSCFDWARDRGAHVISCSWSLRPQYGEPQSMKQAIENAFAEDVTIFIASGNFPPSPSYDIQFPAKLAKYDICSAVGAMTRWGKRSIYSCHGPELSFIAPADGSISTSRVPNWYFIAGGTSAATPVSAGVGALLHSQAYERGDVLLDVDCKRIMEITARDCVYEIGANGYSEEPAIEGWDQYTGYGCVDAYAALERLDEPYIHTHNVISPPLAIDPPYPNIEVVFTNEPNEYLPEGLYKCHRYRLWGTAYFPFRMTSHEVWGLLLANTPGHTTGYSKENPNDAWFQIDVVSVGGTSAVLETYCYELLQYYDPGTGWQPVPEVYKWAPSPPEIIEIPYTLNGIPQGSMSPSDIKEVNTLKPEITVVGSNLGGSITVHYQLPQPTDTRIAVYDVTGREVTTLVSGEQPAGEHELVWKGHDDASRKVSSGVYFVRMEAGNYQINKKVTLIR